MKKERRDGPPLRPLLPEALSRIEAATRAALGNMRLTEEEKKKFRISVEPLRAAPQDEQTKNLLKVVEAEAYPTGLIRTVLPGAFNHVVTICHFVQESGPEIILSDTLMPNPQARLLTSLRSHNTTGGRVERSTVIGQYPTQDDGGSCSVKAVTLGPSSRIVLSVFTPQSVPTEQEAVLGTFDEATRALFWRLLAGIRTERVAEENYFALLNYRSECNFITGYNKPADDKASGVDIWLRLWTLTRGNVNWPVQFKSNPNELALHAQKYPEVSAFVCYKNSTSLTDEEWKRLTNSQRWEYKEGAKALMKEDMARGAQFFCATGKSFVEMEQPILTWLSQLQKDGVITSFIVREDRFWYITNGRERKSVRDAFNDLEWQRRNGKNIPPPPPPAFDSMPFITMQDASGNERSFYYVGTPERAELFAELRPDARVFLLTPTVEYAEDDSIISAAITTPADRDRLCALVMGAFTEPERREIPVPAKYADEKPQPETMTASFTRRRGPTAEALTDPITRKNAFVERANAKVISADLVDDAREKWPSVHAPRLLKALACAVGLYETHAELKAVRFKNDRAKEAQADCLDFLAGEKLVAHVK